MAIFEPPPNCVGIRMYRQGHGDCFLLALPRQEGGVPVHVLIDCGYKPGSPDFVHKKSIGEIVKHIGESTNKHLDLMIVTHEHQDHCNGIWKKKNPYFKDFRIDRAWFAWTEDPQDPLANELRKRHKDQLLGLVEARRQLALAVGETNPSVERLDSLLSLELGAEDEGFNLGAMRAAAAKPSTSVNKQGLKLVREKAESNGSNRVRYLRPGGEPESIVDSAGVRAYVLGPPQSEDLLEDEDPVGGEGFPSGGEAHGFSFLAAARSEGVASREPFAKQYCVAKQFLSLSSTRDSTGVEKFFADHYGPPGSGEDNSDKTEVPANASWRRIDEEWLYSAEALALKLNRGVNNTSLVLAFELPKSKKILLFVGDAQRGNWISWDDQTWRDGDKTVTAKDILGRTVLYKVGHHGSHNATLAGTPDDNYANLSWMAQGRFAAEFTAMITAVKEWAMTKNNPPWRHPLDSIREALETKAEGRVFQTDIDQPEKPSHVAQSTWQSFLSRSTFDELYFDYFVADE